MPDSEPWLTIKRNPDGTVLISSSSTNNETLRDLLFAALRQCPEGITIP
jgi:hypothetical protein